MAARFLKKNEIIDKKLFDEASSDEDSIDIYDTNNDNIDDYDESTEDDEFLETVNDNIYYEISDVVTPKTPKRARAAAKKTTKKVQMSETDLKYVSKKGYEWIKSSNFVSQHNFIEIRPVYKQLIMPLSSHADFFNQFLNYYHSF